MSSPTARVSIVQQAVLQYRTTFYERLREDLHTDGIHLDLLHSNPRETVYRDAIDLDWAQRVPPRWFKVAGRRLLWQPARAALRGTDLVIVEQASKHLLNYVLAAEQLVDDRRLAFWGHGRDFSSAGRGAAEAVKRAMTRRAHWWFAYTQLSADVVAGTGFPRDRITVVQNALDTRSTVRVIDGLTREDVAQVRAEYGVGRGPVGVYLGGLVASKRLAFLREAADAIRRRRGDFQLLVIGAGDGADAVAMEAFAAERDWVHLAGPRFGMEKARALALADVLLVPVWAGLVVVDSFAAGVPLVASGSQPHPPEISYLRNGVNGMIVEDHGDPSRYADAVVDLLEDPGRRSRLAEGARRDRDRYTVETMVERFAAGVRAALAR